MMQSFILTSESVTDGHPDKLCDQMSDAIVGEALRHDSAARIVAECAVSTGIVFAAVKSSAGSNLDIPTKVREVIGDVGYDLRQFNPRECTVMTNLGALPGCPAVDEDGLEEDELDGVVCSEQATLFGFACDQTPSLMPLPIELAHRLARRMATAYRDRSVAGLTPDGKVQVAVEFERRRPVRIFSITLIAHEDEGGQGLDQAEASEALMEAVIKPVFEDQEIRPDGRSRIDVNPEGSVFGGPVAHAGLTGRKTGVDSYGEYTRHSSAALSGKDPSRVDRAGAYAARHAAKNVVAAGLAAECQVLLSYSIGRAQPVSVELQTFGSSIVADETIRDAVLDLCDLRPAAIVRRFGLRRLPRERRGGFYRDLGAYGQMGREDLETPWERLDVVEELRQLSERG